MWKLKQLQDKDMPQVSIKGKWMPARPVNYTRGYMSLTKRIHNAWEVFMCRAEAFTWPEDDITTLEKSDE